MSRPRHPSRLLRAGAVTGLAALALAVSALPAGAHVTVSADDSSKGADDSILTFRVPNEMDGATSMKLDVKFPTTTPLAEVDPQPEAGYTITTKTVTFNPPLTTDDGTIKSGVGEVVWTADNSASAIPVGDFGAFHVLVGPLPDKVDQLVFPAVQTYSNGKVVSWVEPTTDPNDQPEHPAAILKLTAGDDDSHAVTTSAAPDSARASSPAASTAPSAGPAPADVTATPAQPVADLSNYATKSQAKTGRNLGIVGIAVGGLGLLAGAGGIARGRSRQ